MFQIATLQLPLPIFPHRLFLLHSSSFPFSFLSFLFILYYTIMFNFIPLSPFFSPNSLFSSSPLSSQNSSSLPFPSSLFFYFLISLPLRLRPTIHHLYLTSYILFISSFLSLPLLYSINLSFYVKFSPNLFPF